MSGQQVVPSPGFSRECVVIPTMAILTWLAAVAVPWAASQEPARPRVAGNYVITAEQRAFWSFLPVTEPALPKENSGRCVFPTSTAPAFFSRVTTVASKSGTKSTSTGVFAVVRIPLV